MKRQWLFYGLIVILVFLNLYAFICSDYYQGNEGLFTLIAISITAIVAILTLNHSVSESNRRYEKEINEATLKHCRYYLEELQKDLIGLKNTGILDGPVIFRDLKTANRASLQASYPGMFEKYNSSSKDVLDATIQLLNKYNAFAASFLVGRLDRKLGSDQIGYLFCVHVDWLTGLIAFWTPDNDSERLFKMILELRKVWGFKPRKFEHE